MQVIQHWIQCGPLLISKLCQTGIKKSENSYLSHVQSVTCRRTKPSGPIGLRGFNQYNIMQRKSRVSNMLQMLAWISIQSILWKTDLVYSNLYLNFFTVAVTRGSTFTNPVEICELELCLCKNHVDLLFRKRRHRRTNKAKTETSVLCLGYNSGRSLAGKDSQCRIVLCGRDLGPQMSYYMYTYQRDTEVTSLQPPKRIFSRQIPLMCAS